MPYYVRGIVRSKWPSVAPYNCKNFHADSLFCELKTDHNTLSFWKVDGPQEIGKVAAILACSKQHLDTFDVVYISEDRISEESLCSDNEAGDTIFKPYKTMHHNIIDLSMDGLEKICSIILESIETGQCRRYRRRELVELLKKEVEMGSVAKADLPTNILNKIST